MNPLLICLKNVVDFAHKGIQELQTCKDIRPLDAFLAIIKDKQIDVGNEGANRDIDTIKSAYAKMMNVSFQWWDHFRNKNPTSPVIPYFNKILEVLMEYHFQRYIHPSNRTLSMSIADAAGILKFPQDPLRDLLEKMAVEGSIQFPFKSYFEADPKELFHNLESHTPIISNGKFTPQNCRFVSGNLFPFSFDGEYLVIETAETDYKRMDLIADHFQEEQRMKAKRKDEKLCPMDWWKKNVLSMITSLVMQRLDVNNHNMREELFKNVKECTQFKPTLAKTVYKILGGTRILDFSAGWGDRLIGALALPCEYYVGVDPNYHLRKGHLKAVQTLKDWKGEDFPEYCRVIYEPFQTAVLPDKTFNLVFTSPPFFDLEIYTDAEGQSVKSYPEREDWIVHFLFVSLQKAWDVLEMDGHLAIHMIDIMNIRVCEPMNLFIQWKLEGAKYRGVIGTRGASTKILPIWVWKKTKYSDTDAQQEACRFLEKQFSNIKKVYDKYREVQEASRKRKRPPHEDD